ncbi:MAG: transporter substrate-binding domain-containing protein [Firmicutes bacterium]|nr:transporter substrate-binding domain-containing protein [Bacillota bacterium]
MKKVLKSMVSAAMALSMLAGCSKPAEEPKDLYDQIIEKGVLVVGTEGTYQPNTYHDESGELVGFDVEVAKVIADYFGVEVKYEETEWASIFSALDAGKIDIIVNEVGYNEERAEKYDFSEPYSFVQQAILVKEENNDINAFEDLKGKICANEATSLFGETAQNFGAELDPVNAMAQSISEVVNGRADATLNYITSFASYMKENPDAGVKIAALGETEPSSYVPVVKGNAKLVEKINEALKDALESGKLKEISMKYYGVDVTSKN